MKKEEIEGRRREERGSRGERRNVSFFKRTNIAQAQLFNPSNQEAEAGKFLWFKANLWSRTPRATQ